MAERNLSTRLSVVDGGKVKAELSEIGAKGGALAQKNRSRVDTSKPCVNLTMRAIKPAPAA